jgi:murein DD-endopeptidase MepM/ murein hydrolase activator NlpD
MTMSIVGACLVCAAIAAAGEPRLELRLHARAVKPGEPVLVDLLSALPLARAEAVFLGRPVSLLPRSADAGGERWCGWSLVDFDDEPGRTELRVEATTHDGKPLAAAIEVEVLAASFPEERLDVEPRFVEPPPDVAGRIEREREKLAALYAVRRVAPSPAGPFVRPVPGAPTSAFGTRRVYNGRPRSPHPGLDLRAAEGTPVAASGAGRVVLAEDLYYSGNTVIVDHGGGLFTIYAHLSLVSVHAGDEIEAGRLVGRSGATGRVTGPHLHWGAKVGDRPFDPTALLSEALFE